MILVIIICSILYIIMISLLYYLYIEYKQDYKEIEERLLQFEKRVTENEELSDKCIYHLNKLIERSNYLEWVHIPDTSQLMKFLNDCSKKKENNIQEGCESCMPCGRKGRPKGSKNIGGRRK